MFVFTCNQTRNTSLTWQQCTESEHHRQRVTEMKARLQMAMFRIRTNQMDVPVEELKLPLPKPIPSTPLHQRAVDGDAEDDGLPMEGVMLARKIYRARSSQRLALEDGQELTSSVVKGTAAQSLLGLKRAR